MHPTKPFRLNIASMAIAPVSVLLARTAMEQIDALWACADDPATPVWRAQALAQLAGKLWAKINQPN